MNACVMQIQGGSLVACRFLDRDAADRWAERHNAVVLAWAPLVSLSEAAERSIAGLG